MTDLFLIAAVVAFVLSFVARRRRPDAVRPLRLGALGLVVASLVLALTVDRASVVESIMEGYHDGFERSARSGHE